MSGTRARKAAGIDVLDLSVTPGEKAAYVRNMFDDIAPRYDLLNSVLSGGIHHGWRKFATRCAALQPGDSVLDICTGTGDWAVALRKVVGRRGQVVGLDFSRPMLQHGKAKFDSIHAACLQADAVALPFAGNSFDAVTVAFGIRNITQLSRAFAEMARVVRPGGRVVCLEFAKPHPGLFRMLYDGYSKWVMPTLGGAVSGRPDAYTYLPESVARFKSRAELAEMMREAGFSSVRQVDLTCGLVCVHVGTKL